MPPCCRTVVLNGFEVKAFRINLLKAIDLLGKGVHLVGVSGQLSGADWTDSDLHGLSSLLTYLFSSMEGCVSLRLGVI